MRVAVISDVHGNIHALTSALEAIREDAPDLIWCLGDLVGYGARPNECCLAVQAVSSICLVGNHDLGVLGRLDLVDFSPEAAIAARWTRVILEQPARAFLEALEPGGEAEGVQLFHASPRDPVWEYVLTEEAARAALDATWSPIVLIGHSHVPLAVKLDRGRMEGGHAPGGTELDLRQGRWLLNPGSIGQPRDGNPDAAYLLLDIAAKRASFKRVPYPVERTQVEIRSAGLPETLAERLGSGV
jgi:predicted phosphodiesterase